MDVLYFRIAISQVLQAKSRTFCSYDTFELLLPSEENSTAILMWSYRKKYGLCFKSSRKSLLQLLLLACGDIETCPGPMKCFDCKKKIEKRSTKVQCSSCESYFHSKCFWKDNEEKSCNRCVFDNEENPENLGDVSNVSYLLPELSELLSMKGLKILHQNINGLIRKKHLIQQILQNFKGIYIFSLSETHLSSCKIAETDIPGYTFISKHRKTGSGGGVGAYISSSIPFERRYDLENELIECIWIEILFPNTKGLLLGIVYRPPDSSNHIA